MSIYEYVAELWRRPKGPPPSLIRDQQFVYSFFRDAPTDALILAHDTIASILADRHDPITAQSGLPVHEHADTGNTMSGGNAGAVERT